MNCFIPKNDPEVIQIFQRGPPFFEAFYTLFMMWIGQIITFRILDIYLHLLFRKHLFTQLNVAAKFYHLSKWIVETNKVLPLQLDPAT